MGRVRAWIKKIPKWVWLAGTVFLVVSVVVSKIHRISCPAPTAKNVVIPDNLNQSPLAINCADGFQYYVSADSFDLSTSQSLVCSAGVWTTSLKDCDVQSVRSLTIHQYSGYYVGQLDEEGEAHGKGTWNVTNGDKYFGNFLNGAANGQGTEICSNG
eukprot:821421_1